MEENNRLNKGIKKLSQDLRSFIELSLNDPEGSWDDWLSSMADRSVEVKCWEAKGCDDIGCPAYQDNSGRCWLIAGTMCGGEVQGKYAQKYKTCCECEVYKKAVFNDPLDEVYEHVLTLVHSLKSKQEELKHLATRDLLTGLFNRNYFNISIWREIEKIRRSGGRPLFVMIDINNFKYVNDNYGHLFGDRLLKVAASILDRSTRTSDLLVRLGGDEFLVLLPSVSGDEVAELVKRIKEHTKEWNVNWGTPDYELSFSIGHAEMQDGETLDECLAKADAMMYVHKTMYG